MNTDLVLNKIKYKLNCEQETGGRRERKGGGMRGEGGVSNLKIIPRKSSYVIIFPSYPGSFVPLAFQSN